MRDSWRRNKAAYQKENNCITGRRGAMRQTEQLLGMVHEHDSAAGHVQQRARRCCSFPHGEHLQSQHAAFLEEVVLEFEHAVTDLKVEADEAETRER